MVTAHWFPLFLPFYGEAAGLCHNFPGNGRPLGVNGICLRHSAAVVALEADFDFITADILGCFGVGYRVIRAGVQFLALAVPDRHRRLLVFAVVHAGCFG